MKTDTSAEALEKLASKTMPGDYEMVSVVGEMRKTLRALAAEKRRAREGVTEDDIQAWQYCMNGNWYTTSSDEPWRSKGLPVRALVVAAVWPDGRDEKLSKINSLIGQTRMWCLENPTSLLVETLQEFCNELDAAMQDTDHD